MSIIGQYPKEQGIIFRFVRIEKVDSFGFVIPQVWEILRKSLKAYQGKNKSKKEIFHDLIIFG